MHSFSGSFVGRFPQVSWSRCHSSAGFSLSQSFMFLCVIPDRLDDGEIRSLCGHWLLALLLDYYT